MNNINIYLNSFPAKDKGFKGKEYNNNFLANLRKSYKKNIKIYTSSNFRKDDLNFQDFLFEFCPKDIFENINCECRNKKNFTIIDNLTKESNTFFASKIATSVCKSKYIRLRLASELYRYSNKLSTSSTYDLIYRLAVIYANQIKIRKINYAIFYETPHSFWDTILCEVMKLMNCKLIILTRTLFDNLLLDREEIKINGFQCDYCKKERNKVINYINQFDSFDKNIEIKSFWNSFNQKNILKAQNTNIKKTQKIYIKNKYIYSITKSIYSCLIKLIIDIKNQKDWRDTSEIFYFKNSIWCKLRASFQRFIYNLTILRRKDLYHKFVTKLKQNYFIEDLNKKFIYYPLPVEPERTTIPEGGENWYHLMSTISQIRSLIPKDFALIIKEHPNMFIQRQSLLGYRTPFFYKTIANLENTYLLNYNFDSSLILKAAKVVIINSGSSGFEAFLNGTRVIALGDPWYKDIKGIKNASSCKELLSSLETCLSKKDLTINKTKQNLNKFISQKNFIYGSTSAGLTKIIDYFSIKELRRHSLKSACSLINYINFIELTKY